MEQIIANTAQLNNILLQTSDEEYDTVAWQSVAALKKSQLPDATTSLQLLQTLDPLTQTIPYLFLLSHVIQQHRSSKSSPASVFPESQLWPFVTNIILNLDPIQARYAGSQVLVVVDAIYHGAEQAANHVPSIQLLQHLILNLDPTSSTLTTAHFYYIRLCLLAKAYVEAVTILDLPIYHIPTTESTKTLDKRLGKYLCSRHEASVEYINTKSMLSGRITMRLLLEYYFMGALCCIATRQFKKAQDFLEVVLIAPTHQNTASLVMVDAYRKWILIGLILTGRIPHTPKAVNANAIKHIRVLAKPYECVADAFKAGSDRLVAEIQEGNEQWQGDGNYGLMLELVAACRKFHVVRLADTYAALPVEDPAWQMSKESHTPQEILTFVQSLIITGQLQAEVLPGRKGSLGIIRFLPSTTAHLPELEVGNVLAQKSMELKTLLKHISDYDHQIAVNKDYVDWLVKAKKARDSEKKDAAPTGQEYPIGKPPGTIPGDWQDESMMDGW